MNSPILYTFRRCPYAMRARMAIILSSKQCELREILLKKKPKEMLEVSPKGTVPVLHLGNQVLDESLDIIEWAMQSRSDEVHSFLKAEKEMSNDLIQLFDTKFKHHLDRYKYASRHGTNAGDHQNKCLLILNALDTKIEPNPWIFGNMVSLLDISILPFIRQCKIANPDWFMSQDFKKTIALLDYFESSELFDKAMKKFSLWDPEDPIKVIFP